MFAARHFGARHFSARNFLPAGLIVIEPPASGGGGSSLGGVSRGTSPRFVKGNLETLEERRERERVERIRLEAELALENVRVADARAVLSAITVNSPEISLGELVQEVANAASQKLPNERKLRLDVEFIQKLNAIREAFKAPEPPLGDGLSPLVDEKNRLLEQEAFNNDFNLRILLLLGC